MNRWIKCFLIVTENGGGFTGLVFLLRERPWSETIPIDMRIFSALFAFLYIFGITAGITLVEWPRRGIQFSLIYQVLQIPVISSPCLTYVLVSGVRLVVGWRGDKVFVLYEFGSRVVLYLMQENPWVIGINVLALLLVVYLIKQLRSNIKATTQSVENINPDS